MKGTTDKKKNSKNNQTKPSVESETALKGSYNKAYTRTLVSDSNTGSESSEVYENMAVHYVDDIYRFEEASQDSEINNMIEKENKDEVNDHSSALAKGLKPGMEEELQGDENEIVKSASRSQKRISKKDSSESYPLSSRVKSDQARNEARIKASHKTPNKAIKSSRVSSKPTIQRNTVKESRTVNFPSKPSSESSEGLDEKSSEEVRVADIPDEASTGTQSIGSDDETTNAVENGENDAALDQKVIELEMRIEKLEDELREVAVLEISLYSVVPEHGTTSHKVHTPARRLSRLYIHACKYWSQDKRATVATNTVSGFVMVAKSCGSDVPRLTFWLSNVVVLRELISGAFGISSHSNYATSRTSVTNGGTKSEAKLRNGGGSGGRQTNKPGLVQFAEDWQDPRTFTAALEKVESWIFSRIVESIWWQTITPNMQSPAEDLNTSETVGMLLGPALGDHKQGSFSFNLWKKAFQDAFKRLCPVRAGGHECGCLPVLARMVMKQCIARLDVAMFNAILRESAHEIPTDPVSDPIVDSKVLPVPAGNLSFGSGAQLKNLVGNWSRWLTELFDMDVNEHRFFRLLDSLSDLLMIPKEMLMDRSIRTEVCPLISLPLVKRILCNFTPDEFCQDPVPGALLEALNAECFIERRLFDAATTSFPYSAAPVVYSPPAPAAVAEKVAESAGKSQLVGNNNYNNDTTTPMIVVPTQGYTSDDELELYSPLSSIIENLSSSSPTVLFNGNGNHKDKISSSRVGMNARRYELIREVWLSSNQV